MLRRIDFVDKCLLRARVSGIVVKIGVSVRNIEAQSAALGFDQPAASSDH